jgi:hypothetical protein
MGWLVSHNLRVFGLVPGVFPENWHFPPETVQDTVAGIDKRFPLLLRIFYDCAYKKCLQSFLLLWRTYTLP